MRTMDAELNHPASGGSLASCALWWRHTPPDPEDGARVGCVGKFTCVDVDAGAALLQDACRRLAATGCQRVVGPMDGDTWHSYRLVSAGWDRTPRFFLEPWNPPEHVHAFEQAGFTAWARFSSSAFELVAPNPETRDRHERLLARLGARGVVIRPLQVDAFEEELGRLFDLSAAAFTENFLYTPIPRAEFLELYQPVRPIVRPEFVQLAEKDGEPIGFVFAVPDVLAPDAGRLVVKTLAVHPRFRHLGLGTILVDVVQEAARLAGMREAVHALQHERNSSLKITGRNAGSQIREYTLYQRPAILP